MKRFQFQIISEFYEISGGSLQNLSVYNSLHLSDRLRGLWLQNVNIAIRNFRKPQNICLCRKLDLLAPVFSAQ